MQVALLRGVNVGGKNKLPMAQLRALCERIGLLDVKTYIQSGNIVFRAAKGDVGARIQSAIRSEFGVECVVVVRTSEEMRELAGKNPFPGRDPRKLLVAFLAGEPPMESVKSVEAMNIAPEEVRILGREMFIYFPLGQGVSKLPIGKIERILGTTGTGRNWNTVEQLIAML